jgi:DNA-binding transcriptional regulator YhcF (GntR family)
LDPDARHTAAAWALDRIVMSTTGQSKPSLGELPGHSGYVSTRRVFRIIDRVSRDGERLTVKALAHDLGISVSTCYHLIAVLTDEGYVEKLPQRAGYRLGPTIGVLFERSRKSSGAAAIEPTLHDLARLADRTATRPISRSSPRTCSASPCPCATRRARRATRPAR